MIDVNVLLFDDERDQIGNIKSALTPIADPDHGDLTNRGPWFVRLGPELAKITCEVVDDPDVADAEFAVVGRGQKIRSADLILLDNDWNKAQRKPDFGLRLLEKSKWQRGAGPMLAVYTQRQQELPRYLLEALGHGADAFIYKGESTHFLNILLTLIERKRLIVDAQKLQQLGGILGEQDPGLVSVSAAMQETLQNAALLAPWRNEYVLILGAVGTGKTRLAKAIHDCSPRAESPFVILDPSHIGDTLVHAELFGARRGAYTGAVVNRKGLLESASGGTVFIDEFENMSANMQDIMLRVIAERKYNRPGEPEEHDLDVRFLFATNVDPDELVRTGRLRSDLFSRINQHVIRLPRLEDRREDIPLLAQTFVKEFYSENLPGLPKPAITEAAIEELKSAEWPDNIRGLRNAIRRSLVRLARGSNLDAKDLVFSGDSVLGQAGGDATIVKDSDIGVLLGLAPRAGSQRIVFDRLVDKIPDTVSNEDLNEAIGQSRNKVATPQLMQAAHRLRSRLEQHGFSVRQERDQGYALVRLIEHV